MKAFWSSERCSRMQKTRMSTLVSLSMSIRAEVSQLLLSKTSTKVCKAFYAKKRRRLSTRTLRYQNFRKSYMSCSRKLRILRGRCVGKLRKSIHSYNSSRGSPNRKTPSALTLSQWFSTIRLRKWITTWPTSETIRCNRGSKRLRIWPLQSSKTSFL